MSRIGKLPVPVPSGVAITIENNVITVAGSKGTLSQNILPGVRIQQEADQLIVSRQDDEKTHRANHGLTRALINNMVTGVSQGYSKQLEINGVGFRVALAGADLRFNIGFSHDVTFPIPQGVTADIQQNIITISGFDKQQVGQVAAQIRSLKKPEPYKGKGIKYVGERILRKSGKSGKEK